VPRFWLSRTLGLRDAASVVFALVAILPILVLVYLLSQADLLRHGHAQLGIFLALLVSVLGFLVFRRMVGQIVRLADAFQASASGQGFEMTVDARSSVVPTLAEVPEIGQITTAFRQMIDDLRASTQRLEDIVFKLGTLNETVELAARVPKIQDLLSLVLQNTMRAVRATVGSIMILDPDRQVLTRVVSQGIPDDVGAQVEVRLGEGIAGQVAAQGEPVLVENIETDPRFARENAARYSSGSFICMPIRVRDRVIGVINLAKKRGPGEIVASPAPFSPTDLQFLNALLTYIGYSVENARLLQDAQQSAQRLKGVVEDLKTTQSQLVRGETLRALGQLSSGMAHHLNNLLAVIVGRAELALLKTEDEPLRRALEIILRTSRDGAEVVRRVQRFGRLEPPSDTVACDVNEIVQEVVELTRVHWQDEAQRRGSRIEVRVIPGVVPLAVGEPGPIREVVMNLVLNAVEAIGDGGLITIRTGADASRVHCVVTDDGPGITEDVRRRAFEPFFTTKGPKSTGLGLSVAYGTVQRYGGTLALESVERQGTTATVSLPLAAASGPRATPAIRGGELSPIRILVIDDEAEVRTVLADLLTAERHNVLQAASGREGLAMLEEGLRVDLVLTDLGMSGMRGSDVARTIRVQWPGLPVGLITGWGEHVTTEELEDVRFVIAKPFDAAALRQAFSSLTKF